MVQSALAISSQMPILLVPTRADLSVSVSSTSIRPVPMRIPRKRRPQRTFRWVGYVLPWDENCWTQGDGVCVSDGPCMHTREPGLKTFWARLVPSDHKGPEIEAEFDESSLLRDLKAGEYLTLHVYRKGRKARILLRRKKVGAWTEEELALIGAKADEWVATSKAWIQ